MVLVLQITEKTHLQGPEVIVMDYGSGKAKTVGKVIKKVW
jgi:hypothetical protein